MRDTERVQVAWALGLAQLFFGVHYMAAKLVLAEIPPRAWATFRALAAAAVLLALHRALRRRWPARWRDWAAMAVCALFGVVINQICFVEGLARTTTAHSAIINTTIPVGALLFAVALGRERLTLRKALSLGAALAGVVLVIHPWSRGVSLSLRGDILTLINATSYAFFLVISKTLLGRIEPFTATAGTLCLGALGIAAYGATAAVRVDPTHLSLQAWVWAAFIVLFATIAAYFLNNWALVRVDSSVVALFCYFQPVVAALLGFFVLGERPTLDVYLGAALIFTGVWFALRRPPQ